MNKADNAKKHINDLQYQIMYKFSIFLVLSLIWSCTRNEKNINKDNHISIIEQNNITLTELEIVVADSVSEAINERQEEILTGNIFGGVKFGMNNHTYKNAIIEYNRKYDMQIFILRDNDNVDKIRIDEITPYYYQNKLYKLDILIMNTSSIHYIEPLFISKYGITKERLWEFKNASIEIKIVSNSVYDSMRSAGYRSTNTNNTLYYASTLRGKGAPITKEPAFTHIIYTDISLEKQALKEAARIDSLKQDKERKEKLIEINKANRQIEYI